MSTRAMTISGHVEAAPPPLSAQFDEQEKKDSNRKTLK